MSRHEEQFRNLAAKLASYQKWQMVYDLNKYEKWQQRVRMESLYAIYDETCRRMEEVCNNLERYVHEASEQGRPDSPGRHFHIATINRLRRLGLAAVFDDNLYFEYLYATLAAWGLDRGAKLKGFDSFVQGICSNREKIMNLSTHTLAEEDLDAFVGVCSSIAQLIPALGVAQGESQLEAGSKAHLLPDLVLPLDRHYTLKFFFSQTNTANEDYEFVELFINYQYMFKRGHETIKKILEGGNPLNSSVTKVIDNAIKAYQIKHDLDVIAHYKVNRRQLLRQDEL